MTLIYFILVLGITVFIHELGHFIFAKKAGVYVYEFSIGMGPIIYKKKSKKDETVYCLRLFPIGGFVSMAGEDMEVDKSIPEEKQLYNKPWLARFKVIVAGVVFNFLLAFVLLFFIGIKVGYTDPTPIVASKDISYPIYTSKIALGDEILKINGKRTKTTDDLTLQIQLASEKEAIFTVKHQNGTTEDIKVQPLKVNVNGTDINRFGFTLLTDTKHGILEPFKYAFYKFGSLIKQMGLTIGYLVTGKLKLNNLSGPVGIYNVVSETAKTGFINLVYLIAYLCVNVGFINIIPIPAFDGGRLLFLIIEKIKGSKVDPKLENTIHSIGFVLLLILMILITYNDIIRIFK